MVKKRILQPRICPLCSKEFRCSEICESLYQQNSIRTYYPNTTDSRLECYCKECFKRNIHDFNDHIWRAECYEPKSWRIA